MATYAWALGWTRDPSGAEPLIGLCRRTKSEWIKQNCMRALAMIGGRTAGEYLLSVFDGTPDKDGRFGVLNLLCEMRYESALPKTEEVLKEDPDEYYWKSIFVFGKMGDKAVPFLLTKIHDENPNVRNNTIHVLGQWLAAPEAAQPLLDRFWKEKDEDLRMAILGSLERTLPDPDQMKACFEQVVVKEKSEQVLNFAKETLSDLDKLTAGVAQFAREKKISAADFKREYSRLYKSTGQAGDYDVLRASSSLSDEPKLKALREHILLRDSDESFSDYEKVNNIIMLNRWAARLKSR